MQINWLILDFKEKNALENLRNQLTELPDTIIHNARSLETLKIDNDGRISNSNFQEEFYNGITFHRVIPDFVIQGGCPEGTGVGGPGYSIDCELDGENQFHDKGVLSMAHAGRNTGGSQFFICHSRNNTAHLDRNHTCFGKVVEGLEVIDLISEGDKINTITIS